MAFRWLFVCMEPLSSAISSHFIAFHSILTHFANWAVEKSAHQLAVPFARTCSPHFVSLIYNLPLIHSLCVFGRSASFLHSFVRNSKHSWGLRLYSHVLINNICIYLYNIILVWLLLSLLLLRQVNVHHTQNEMQLMRFYLCANCLYFASAYNALFCHGFFCVWRRHYVENGFVFLSFF